MNKSDVEMDMVILAYTNCQTINLPNGYTEMLNQRISQAKGKEHLDFIVNNSDYLQKARKYGHFTGYKN